jgi:hypothetical protein
MKTLSRFGGVVVVMGAMLPMQISAQQDSPSYTFGVAVGGGLSASPLGNIAERHGTFLIPGKDYEVWLTYGAAESGEFSLGMLADRYQVNQEFDSRTYSRFHYSSVGAFAGYSFLGVEGRTPVRYGVDLGWRWFSVESDRPDYYTGEPSVGATKGNALALGVTAGIEVPLDFGTAVPRVRVETNYPSFGGGDGYSELHRASDLGFRASVGIQLKYGFRSTRQSRGSAEFGGQKAEGAL